MAAVAPHRRGLPPALPQRGAALLLAMLILVLVATFTGAMVWQQNRSLQIEAAERARGQAAWILSGALDWARLILREDARGSSGAAGGAGARGVDSLDEPWNTPLAESRLSTFLAADKDNNAEDQGPEAFLSGAIVDAQSRWNLRSLFDAAGKEVPAERAVLGRLCAQANVSADTAQRIAEQLRGTWAPAVNNSAAAAGQAAETVNNPMLPPSRLADLAWIGIEPAVLERLEAWIDVLPVMTPVNVNTAPREVLVGVIEGLDVGTAERLVRARQSKRFESIEQFKAQLPEGLLKDATRVSVGSNWFQVYGRLRLEERVLEERSLLERRGTEVLVARRERLSLSAAAAGPLAANATRRP
jgi:general secretion pathway protein K